MTDTMDEDPSSGIQSSSEEEEPIESLIRGRAKRSTAGLHMSALIDAAADDDLTLLFEEVEDDNEFAMEAGPEAGADKEDDMLDSSSDDDDDQGPDAGNDYEGEEQLQKEERKKRKAQNNLRFQTLRKRVKIDPTALSSMPAPPPRPKKKSERISWIPTPEDGPTRSSSRRQTMHNKELTHARLKDSQEKRVRIIATMKEAEKRKAHLKPKEMTQEDHLVEAARIERLNSKTVNRWEEAERRKADERRLKIEALQNRRLDGPVMSYWSGLATWVNGRLTRVGKVDVKPKPSKEELALRKAKKLEKEREEMEREEKAAAELRAKESAANTTTLQPQPESSEASISGTASILPDTKPLDQPADTAAPPPSVEVPPSNPHEEQPTGDPPATATVVEEEKDEKLDKETPKPTTEPSAQKPGPAVETPVRREPSASSPKSTMPEPSSVEDADAMDMDQSAAPTDATKDTVESQAPTAEESKSKTDELSTTTPNGVPNADAPATLAAGDSADAIPLENAAIQEPPSADGVNGTSSQPAIPPPPPVVEHTGRTLTILENFDDRTAHSKQYNIYFNAKKPPRLTKISSSLCVITSLPSRYRDPETSLPYANSYAYGQIRRMLSQGHIWSSMLGCFVGPAGVAARGVPERFLGDGPGTETGATVPNNGESVEPS
ncbi:YL1 nuclear [Penicillium lagena]|uniref:YL1 nuclear n=1 Tax=Penicillium lagena TaxID=94218 RepID=UPI0025425AE3|nr:YL1 nuclear [Penicillium lagena]KAJ5605715.1 YL1 nuclear [Penicillium lagena]